MANLFDIAVARKLSGGGGGGGNTAKITFNNDTEDALVDLFFYASDMESAAQGEAIPINVEAHGSVDLTLNVGYVIGWNSDIDMSLIIISGDLEKKSIEIYGETIYYIEVNGNGQINYGIVS